MDADFLPRRIQRFRLKLMRITYKVLYIPGHLLAMADTLSRAPQDGPTTQHADHMELFIGELLHSFPDFISSRKDEMRHAQPSDGVCNLLLEYCIKGWPRQSKLPLHVKKYWQHRGDLSISVKRVFACHGILRVVHSDNGPQFSSKDFSTFSQACGFKHVTSSPQFPQSNGEMERMVWTVKDLLLEADDPYFALIAYRDTPGVNGASPAHLLMDTRLPTRVPKTSQQLEPPWPPSRPFYLGDQANRRKQAREFNRMHAAHSQRPLKSGEQVWVQDKIALRRFWCQCDVLVLTS
ncbi:uncharacterized protein LOC144159926 [Haemaphysalis longicornis]